MTKDKFVEKVNKLSYEGLYSFEDLEYAFDEAIDEINIVMNSSYPRISDYCDTDDKDYDCFPEKYQDIVINFAVAEMFRIEGEFGNEYFIAEEKAKKKLDAMFRDYFSLVPESYQAVDEGMLTLDNGVEEETLYNTRTVTYVNEDGEEVTITTKVTGDPLGQE